MTSPLSPAFLVDAECALIRGRSMCYLYRYMSTRICSSPDTTANVSQFDDTTPERQMVSTHSSPRSACVNPCQPQRCSPTHVVPCPAPRNSSFAAYHHTCSQTGCSCSSFDRSKST